MFLVTALILAFIFSELSGSWQPGIIRCLALVVVDLFGWATPLTNMGRDDDMTPTVSGKSHKIPWFQSPPSSHNIPIKYHHNVTIDGHSRIPLIYSHHNPINGKERVFFWRYIKEDPLCWDIGPSNQSNQSNPQNGRFSLKNRRDPQIRRRITIFPKQTWRFFWEYIP